MIYAYVRVSTDSQDCENQKIGILAECERRKLTVDKWIYDDGLSGTVDPNKRALGGLLKRVRTGDIIVCSELSRLGRKLFMIMRILEHCMNVGAKLYTVKDGYELEDNIQSKVLAFAFGLAAEIERDLISARTKEALELRRRQGKHLGRPFGLRPKHKLDGLDDKIIKMHKKGYSKAKIARKLHVSYRTMWGRMKEMGL